MKFRISPRLALVIIASMFLLPLALAWLMYSGALEFNPVSTRNLGQLVEPPVHVDVKTLSPAAEEVKNFDDLDDHWIVLHVVQKECEAACMSQIAGLRQVHRAAGRNQSRVRMVLLLPQDEPAAGLTGIYPSFYLADTGGGMIRASLADIAGRYAKTGNSSGSTYLIDPLGNIMMHYDSGFDPNDLNKDLKRLLTWSKLDEQQ